MNITRDRLNVLKKIYQHLPYLEGSIVSEQEFPTKILDEISIVLKYGSADEFSVQERQLWTKLQNKNNEVIQKTKEQAAEKQKKANYRNNNQSNYHHTSYQQNQQPQQQSQDMNTNPVYINMVSVYYQQFLAQQYDQATAYNYALQYAQQQFMTQFQQPQYQQQYQQPSYQPQYQQQQYQQPSYQPQYQPQYQQPQQFQQQQSYPNRNNNQRPNYQFPQTNNISPYANLTPSTTELPEGYDVRNQAQSPKLIKTYSTPAEFQHQKRNPIRAEKVQNQKPIQKQQKEQKKLQQIEQVKIEETKQIHTQINTPLVQQVKQEIIKQQPKPEVVPVIQQVKFSLEEIKNFIHSFKDYDSVPKALRQKVDLFNNRKIQVQTIVIPQGKKKPAYNKKITNQKPGTQKQINKGQKYNPNVANAPTTFVPNRIETLIIGANESQEVKDAKAILQNAAKDGGFLGKKAKQNLGQLQKYEKQIKFNLNLVTLQNFDKIKTILIQFATHSQQVCEKLTALMIEKAWIQPKFAVIYAKLSSQLSKTKETFKFSYSTGGAKIEGGQDKKGSKNNPFKTILIKEVQSLFEQNQEQRKNDAKHHKEKAQKQIKQRKKKIIGNVRFIGQLITEKVLPKKIASLAIGTLIDHFFYQHFSQENFMNVYLAEFFGEAIIELIQKIGKIFQNSEGKDAQYQNINKKLLTAIKQQRQLKHQQIETLRWSDLSTDHFFKLFDLLDTTILSIKYHRISALLKNLIERRQNDWKLHLVTQTGPKTLDQIKKQVQQGEQIYQEKPDKVKQTKSVDYEKCMLQIFEKYQKGQYVRQDSDLPIPYKIQNAVKDLTNLKLTHQFFVNLLNTLPNGKKQLIKKRLQLFDVLVKKEAFRVQLFENAWLESISKLTYADLPYSQSAIGYMFAKVNQQFKIKVERLTKPTQDEQQQDYMKDVLLKINHYTQDKELKEILEGKIQTSAKLRMLI